MVFFRKRFSGSKITLQRYRIALAVRGVLQKYGLYRPSFHTTLSLLEELGFYTMSLEEQVTPPPYWWLRNHRHEKNARCSTENSLKALASLQANSPNSIPRSHSSVVICGDSGSTGGTLTDSLTQHVCVLDIYNAFSRTTCSLN